MTLDRVEAGDPLSAADQNLLIEQVNMLSRPAATCEAQFGTDGITFFGRPETRLALFELTSTMYYPNTSGASTDHLDREPTPWAYAKPIYCHQFHETDVNGTVPVRSYGSTASSPNKVVWFPLTARNDTGYGITPPIAGTGARVLCLFNRQSARWEVIQGPPYHLACWGRLDEVLNAGSSTTVSLYWGGGDSGVNITAYDWLLTAGTHLAIGAKVKVEFFPQDGIWWVTAGPITGLS